MTQARRRILLVTGFLVATLVVPIVVLPPLAWWLRGYQIHQEEMHMEAVHMAGDLAVLASQQGARWGDAQSRLQDLVGVDRFPNSGNLPERRVALDARGRSLYLAGLVQLASPLISEFQPVRVGERVVGYAEVSRSLHPLLRETLTILFVGLFLGGALLFALWRWVIRALRQAWRELETEKGRAQVTLSSIDDAVFALDRDGLVTYLNVSAESLTGWPTEEALGRRIEEVLRPSGWALPSDASNQPSASADSHGCGEIVSQTGARYQVEWAQTTLTGKDQEGRVLVVRDVGQRHRAEAALRLSEAALRRSAERLAIIHAVDAAILGAHTAEAVAAAALGQVSRLVPYLRASVLVPIDDTHMRVLAVGGLDHLPGQAGDVIPIDDTFRYLRMKLTAGTGPILQPLSVADANPQLRALAEAGACFVFIVPLFWHERLVGSLNFSVAEAGMVEGEAREVILEIAEVMAIALRQAMLNDEVASYAERLERTVAERTAELVRAARAKDEFLAAMSHELRTPLTAVLGLAEVLREQAYGPVNAKQARYLRQIEDSGRHLLELINEILDLAKIEAGKLDIEPGTIELARLLAASLEMVRPAAEQKAIQLSVREDARVTHLCVDARRIKQALVNLLANAVKFTPDGGQVELAVDADLARGEVRLTVSDTGIGIAAEHLPKLFQAFVQVDSTLARHYGGTGLGLALVKGMVELHGGRVEVASTPGEGSRFSLILPWQPDFLEVLTVPEVAAPAAPAPIAQVASVLVVDDNEINRLLVQEMLTSEGYPVTCAVGGEEALAWLAANPLPDVVLLDVRMPHLDGPETLACLRAEPRTAGLRVIALTAQAMSGDRERLLAQGYDDYLAKPFTLAELLEQVTTGGVRQ